MVVASVAVLFSAPRPRNALRWASSRGADGEEAERFLRSRLALRVPAPRMPGVQQAQYSLLWNWATGAHVALLLEDPGGGPVMHIRYTNPLKKDRTNVSGF